MSDTISIPLEIEKDELWSNICGSFEGHFDWWADIQYVDTDWEHHGTLKLSVYTDLDSSDETTTKTITVDDLAKAYAIAISKPYYHCGTKVDINDMDECASDIVLQIVMFGDVIYG